MLAEGPAEIMPPRHRHTTALFYSQGLQQHVAPRGGVLRAHFPTIRDGVGVVSKHYPRPIPLFLYMDDTTLLGTSIKGLSTATGRYLNFCSKFRVRVNHTKSKLMKFQASGVEEPVSMTVGPTTFTSRDPKTQPPQKLLGFTMDPALTGVNHLASSTAKAKQHMRHLAPMAERLGEAHTLHHLQHTVAPSALYATELISAPGAPAALDALWERSIELATLSRPSDHAWLPRSFIRTRSLRWHSTELPWSFKQSMQGIRLDAKLKGQGSSLAQIIRSAQCSRSYVDPLLQSASTEAAALHIKRLPVPGVQRRKWVNRL